MKNKMPEKKNTIQKEQNTGKINEVLQGDSVYAALTNMFLKDYYSDNISKIKLLNGFNKYGFEKDNENKPVRASINKFLNEIGDIAFNFKGEQSSFSKVYCDFVSGLKLKREPKDITGFQKYKTLNEKLDAKADECQSYQWQRLDFIQEAQQKLEAAGRTMDKTKQYVNRAVESKISRCEKEYSQLNQEMAKFVSSYNIDPIARAINEARSICSDSQDTNGKNKYNMMVDGTELDGEFAPRIVTGEYLSIVAGTLPLDEKLNIMEMSEQDKRKCGNLPYVKALSSDEMDNFATKMQEKLESKYGVDASVSKGFIVKSSLGIQASTAASNTKNAENIDNTESTKSLCIGFSNIFKINFKHSWLNHLFYKTDLKSYNNLDFSSLKGDIDLQKDLCKIPVAAIVAVQGMYYTNDDYTAALTDKFTEMSSRDSTASVQVSKSAVFTDVAVSATASRNTGSVEDTSAESRTATSNERIQVTGNDNLVVLAYEIEDYCKKDLLGDFNMQPEL